MTLALDQRSELAMRLFRAWLTVAGAVPAILKTGTVVTRLHRLVPMIPQRRSDR